MRKSSSGFTIVELLIVIVVIAILAAISTSAYQGIQARAENTRTITGVKEYVKILKSYQATNGDYPVTGGNGACLGNGYSSGGHANTCTTLDAATPYRQEDATLNQLLQSIANPLPQVSTNVVGNYFGQILAGSNVTYTSPNNTWVRYYLKGLDQTCSAGGQVLISYDNFTACYIILN